MLARAQECRIPVLWIFVLVCLSSEFHSLAANFYIDYQAGSDSNTGSSPASAWRHAPGDPNAGGNARRFLMPGDNVIFKGGVVYRGQIILDDSGTTGNPISFLGNAWPGLENTKAIIDGSNLLPTWLPCASAAVAGGNPNWRDISAHTLPLGAGAFTPLFENGDFLWIAQDPAPPDPFFWDNYQSYRIAEYMTSSTLRDPNYFIQSDANYWKGAYVAAYCQPNIVDFEPITAFSPSMRAISYATLRGSPYDASRYFYSILNSIHHINEPGRYSIDEANRLIFLWPRTGLTNVEIGARKFGINLNGKTNVVIQGIRFQKIWGGKTDYGLGAAIANTGRNSANLLIKNNEFVNLFSIGNCGAIHLSGDNVVVEGNVIMNCRGNRGVSVSGSRVVMRNNTVDKVGYTGLWMQDVTSGTISNNLVTNIFGAHANGISVYSAGVVVTTSDIVVACNRVYESNYPFTFAYVKNLLVYNNIFEGKFGVNCWDGNTGYLRIFNNTMPNGISLDAKPSANPLTELSLINNIIHEGFGGFWAVHEHNLYTALRWNQDPRSGWVWGEAEINGSAAGKAPIFVNEEGNDFHLKPSCQAMGAGVNLSAFFNTDIDGNPRPPDGAWDLGAYQSQAGAPAPTPTPITVTFNSMTPLDKANVSSSPITFSGVVASSAPIDAVSLWGNWLGSWNRMQTKVFSPLGPEILTNGGFEITSAGQATGWHIDTDGLTTYTAASEPGAVGQCVSINASAISNWGLNIYQSPPLELGANYLLSFQYKTSGSNSLSVEVTDAAFLQVDFIRKLPETKNAWQSVQIAFAHTNPLADRICVKTGQTPGTFWIDEISVKKLTGAGPADQVTATFSEPVGTGAFSWALEVQSGNANNSSRFYQFTSGNPVPVELSDFSVG